MYLFSEEVTQIAQMTQIFSSIIPYPQMRPIRSDLRRFSQLHCSPLGKRFFDSPAPLCEEGGALSHSQALALTIRARDVAGDAIALPEFWSASGACARKGLAESAYATELRLFVA